MLQATCIGAPLMAIPHAPLQSAHTRNSMKSNALSPAQEALRWLANWLHDQDYDFVTVTPETHRRVLARRAHTKAKTLRDVFGWNMAFAVELLPAQAMARLLEADAVTMLAPGTARSRVRFSCLGGLPYVHSAYPTTDSDAVFFGPDTYRFASLVDREVALEPDIARIVDVGCGAGAGGLLASRLVKEATDREPSVELVDVNPRAIEMARVNAASFGCTDVVFRQSDLYRDIRPGVDLIIANPPYLVDDDERLYRHGGGRFGAALSERIVKEGLALLAPGGRLVLYTGSAIEEGTDAFKQAVLELVDSGFYEATYQELDPDVFGEELDRPPYVGVERIAAVSLVIRDLRPRHPQTSSDGAGTGTARTT
jgi:release factor glutamine methyltransferase